MQLPKKGLPKADIFEHLAALRSDDLKWQDGRAFGYIFDPGQEIMEVGKAAYAMYLSENGLDFTVFKSLMRLEKELAALMATHLGGDGDVVGNFASGGTESIMLAIKAARDYFRCHRPEIKAPEMILPTTGHAAFHKAAHYLDVRVVPVRVDPHTFRADPTAVRRAVGPDTIMIVGSAPSYAHGVVDPIAEMAAIARENDLWCHTDACMGGFLLPYFKRLGATVADFDFTVPGVSSISVDLHKYAYCPKGASIVLYRNKTLRKPQIFACSHWVGYTIVNNAVQSSKSGGPMAAAWAVLHFVGDDGYLEIARRKREAVAKIAAGIQAIDGLRLMTAPDMTLVSFTADEVDVFAIIDEMHRRGWYIQPALAYDNSPAHIHLSIGASNVGREEQFLIDLAASVGAAREVKPGPLRQMLEPVLDSLDPEKLSDADIEGMLAMAGIGGGSSLPERTAEINAVLNLLPPAVREKLLTAYVNNLFVQD
jgi:glutamate/tyrosine decarboxylase-like PLP-dependent enzyme